MPEEIGFGFAAEVQPELAKKRTRAAGAKKNKPATEKPQEPENAAQESLLEATGPEATHEGWGGRREGSGRKKTGLKRPNRSIRATEEEYELVMQFLKTLRANAKKN